MTGSAARPSAAPRLLPPLARSARVAAALAFAGLSLFLLWQMGLETWSSSETAGGGPRRLPSAAGSDRSPLAESALLPRAPPSATAEVMPSPRQILVDLGPPRSEVFVDGRRVGQTPFVGQVRCRPGREISIHVVPERGLPFEEKRLCPP